MYILGDVIDRNPCGIQILMEVMNSANMFMILGNHEYMMLNVLQSPEKKSDMELAEDLGLWYLNGGEVTYWSFLNLPAEEQMSIIRYLEKLPLNRELVVNSRKYLLIHGSPASTYTPNDREYPNETMYAVWKRFDPFTPNDFSDTIICGHTPTIFFQNTMPMEVLFNENVICMDCGCAFPDGRLACLCLETGEVVYSADEKISQ